MEEENMEKLLEFKDFSVSLAGKCLYESLNFTINKGDRYIYWGPNGSGKSLLLELIFRGFTKELEGRYKGLEISGQILDNKGRDWLKLEEKDKEIKIVHLRQKEQFPRNYTVKDVCRQSCAGMNIEFDEKKLDYLLDVFGLQDKKNKKIHNRCSPGEEKLIYLISRILKLIRADLFLLDEPLNHLSFYNSRKFNQLMLEEIKQNSSLAIMMISHCKAATFIDKAIEYQERKIIFHPDYQAYDCFLDTDSI